ncbi:MAG: leucine-rich repeat domain-containing protein [Prevotella sp.]|nr:leucine-rich repeat domain-containing protein [Prevotella sp.]
MKRIFTLILFSIIAFNAIHAEITWTLSNDGTLTISGTDMPYYASTGYVPWYSQRHEIKKITIENGVTSIGGLAFDDCSRLTSITIPNSVTLIGSEAFNGCMYLTSVIIPKSVTRMDSYSFKNCKSLTSITIPESVTYIANGTFYGCSGLASVTISNSATYIGDFAFYGCSALTSITIPESVTYIARYAFSGCSGLTSVFIPNSMRVIGDYAFSGCSGLASITIPESVKSIGAYAFQYCRNLTSLRCDALTPPDCGYNSFVNINKSIPLYVPANSISAYKEAIQWKEFTNILPISVDPTLALTLTDKSADLTKGYYQKGKVTFTRNNMSVGDYATFCLPFDIDLSKTTDVFSKVYVPLNIGFLKSAGTLLLLLDEVNSNSVIKAGQTFVAKCQKSEVVFENCSDVTFDDSTPNPTPSNAKIYNFDGISGALTQNTDVKIKIGGTYSQLSNIDKNNYRALSSNGSFDSTTNVTPFQMYVYMDGNSSLNSKITSISFEFNDEATGIKELRMNNDNSPVYDLNGRMVNEKNLKSGLYIKNGKKIVIN